MIKIFITLQSLQFISCQLGRWYHSAQELRPRRQIVLGVSSFFLKLKCSCCTILYKLQVHNIVIHSFKKLYSIYSYQKVLAIFSMLYNISLYLILYITVCTSENPTNALPLVTTGFFSISVSLLLLCRLFRNLLHFLDSTYK